MLVNISQVELPALKLKETHIHPQLLTFTLSFSMKNVEDAITTCLPFKKF